MGQSLYKLEDMLCDELDDIAEKGELSAGALDTVDKLTHSLKSIKTIAAMEDGGYSRDIGPYRRYSNDRYYRRYSREGMVDRLRSMMEDADSEKERMALRDCISKMEG